MHNIFLLSGGGIAGAINGLFGAGGGMVLVPILGKQSVLAEEELFPSSIAIIGPICVVSLLCSGLQGITLVQLLPYLIGSAVGGVAAGFWGKHIPVLWLHRLLGLLIIWGGIRYLC